MEQPARATLRYYSVRIVRIINLREMWLMTQWFETKLHLLVARRNVYSSAEAGNEAS
jgi:hypothetical protein